MPFEATDPSVKRGSVQGDTRVAYFANQFADARGHGLARYARELHRSLRAFDDLDVVPMAGWSSLPPDALAKLGRDTGLRLTGLGRRGTSLLWTLLGRPAIESRLGGRVDVVHAVALGYPVATRRPLVVTIHDLGPLTHPHFFRNTRPWVMRASLDQALRQAAAIVCVSQSTADEVRDLVGPVADGRLRVVHEGVDESFFHPTDPSCLSALTLPPRGTPFILSAGAMSPRKNLGVLLQALARASDQIPHHLVLVGGAGWDSPDFWHHLADLRLERRVHLAGFVSDAQLRALYQAAELYVHPSLYEGFGLPVLEAMASGTPVIASDRSSLPEVAGAAGRLSDTTDPEALAVDIVALCRSDASRARMIAAGRAHAARFRWSDCAAAMREIYRDAAR